MVAAGVVTFAAAFLGGGVAIGVSIGSLLLGGLFPVVYSYLIWRERGGPSSGQG
jgi:hypothetical protein